MICPHCQHEFDVPAGNCPQCGVRIVRKVSGIVKTSTVMVSAGNEHAFYRSVQDVPELLRKRLIESTNSENSGMIVIADRAGKEQWTEVVARREAQKTQEVAARTVVVAEEESRQGFAGLSWAAWAGILLFLAAGAMIASVFQVFHW